jgi:tetratricopeptide (TPR) repeat protein
MAEHERLLQLQMADGTAGTAGIVEWWLLLASTGRLEAARRAAREVVPVLMVRGPSEARTAANGLMALGLATEAVQFLESAAVARHRDVTLWLLRADALRDLGRWEDLGAFANGLIQGRGSGREALVCGMALRAASEIKLGRPDMARATVRALMELADADGRVLSRLAGWLGQAGLRAEALALMRRAEASMSQNPGYWAQRTLMAGASGNLDDMVDSSRRALGFAPGDPRLRNNHAAALIAARRNPAEAVLLTLQNVQQFPLEPRYRVNHALALLANDRVAEARRALDDVAEAVLPPDQEARRHLAWMELLLREGKASEARQRMVQINRSMLLPFEEARLDELAGRL